MLRKDDVVDVCVMLGVRLAMKLVRGKCNCNLITLLMTTPRILTRVVHTVAFVIQQSTTTMSNR